MFRTAKRKLFTVEPGAQHILSATGDFLRAQIEEEERFLVASLLPAISGAGGMTVTRCRTITCCPMATGGRNNGSAFVTATKAEYA
jgi:hypothetical protein